MAKVSVEKSAVEKSIVLCERTIRHYEEAAGYLEKQYHIAGSGWNDIKATPHKDRLTPLPPACLQIFRHFCPKLLDIRQYYLVVLCNLTKNLLNAIGRQSLCGIALNTGSLAR